MARLTTVAALVAALVFLFSSSAHAFDADEAYTTPLALIQEEMSTRGLTAEEEDLRVALLELDNANEALVHGEAEAEVEGEAEAEAEVEGEAEAEAEVDAEAEAEGEAEAEAEEPVVDENMLLQVGEEPAAEGENANPTYALPYPPLQPHYYSPLFNPYTNVNPLSYPFANYAAQPGTHPGLAQAAAVHASTFAARNAAVAHAGAFPYYPFAGGFPTAAAASGFYAPWVHPQNMNSAKVGTNEAAEFPQFVEVSTEGDSCVNCSFN